MHLRASFLCSPQVFQKEKRASAPSVQELLISNVSFATVLYQGAFRYKFLHFGHSSNMTRERILISFFPYKNTAFRVMFDLFLTKRILSQRYIL